VRSAAEQLEFARIAGSSLFKDLIKSSLLLFAIFALIWLYRGRRLPAGLLISAAMLLAFIDVYAVDYSVLHPGSRYPKTIGIGDQLDVIKDNSEREKFLAPDDVIDFLETRSADDPGEPTDGLFRVFPAFHPAAPLRGGDFATNRYMVFGISSIGGYHAAKLSIYGDFVRALGVALQKADYSLIHMMNARYFITTHPFPDVPFLELLWKGQDYRGRQRHVYENHGALPRVYFVDSYQVGEPDEILNLLPTLPISGVDLSETVLLEEDPDIEPVSKAGAMASISDYGCNEIRVDARLPSPAILVLSEVFYPRWRVYIDGREGKIMKANYLLRAVALPEGDHEIVFRYDTSLLKRGVLISVLTFATALLALISSGVVALRGRPSWKH
jgi:hypothetical protein